MAKQLEALIAEAKLSASIMELIASFEPQDIDGDDIDLRFEVDGFDTGCNVSLVDQCGKASEQLTALIAALEQAQQQSEVSELLRDKVKRLESDIWDSQQLVKVKSENQYELECKVRDLEERNDKSNIAWSHREDEALEKLEAAEKRIAELEQELIKPLPIGELIHRLEAQTNEPWGEWWHRGMSRNNKPEASPLAVKLPTQEKYDDPLSAHEAIKDCAEAIRAAGGTAEGE